MTDAEIQAWQERHTFECPHIRARITPEQCEANRARVGGWSTTGNQPHKINQCERCTEYGALIKTVAERLPKEAKTVAKRGNCECCGRGPYALGGGLCGKCSQHKTAGELMREGDEWVWLIPVPEHALADEPRAEDYHEPVEPKKVACIGCGRNDQKIVGRGLCSGCYRYSRDGRLVVNGDGTEAWWKIEPPAYVAEHIRAFRVVGRKTDREVGEKRHGSPQNDPEVPKTCDKCACPGPCPHPEVSGPDRPVFIGLDFASGTDRSIHVGGLTLTRHVPHRTTSTNQAFAAVRKNAKGMDLALNAVTVIRFGLTKAKYVDVYSDAGAKVLALVPLDEPTDGNSIKLRVQDGNTRVISATGFLRDLGIEDAGRYKVTGDGEAAPGIVVVDFKEKAA
ncbi:hypothetical protein [uncultured Pseudodesulfovibrio sp.]|uniref:hypothetical protein n=1 Tax=uncultured Pseudodesulfovibrio sp. TaxID=2035858 RepID=UPI0029C7FCAC|nr:hypothetical protein [uncultured Pseudodesulfovibrio sp.]